MTRLGTVEREGLLTSSPTISKPATRHSQRGVALIITLILLSVVTFMAVTFLVLSRRERGAVTTVTDTAGARLAADAALANAEAQIMANALASTNPFNFGLLVSTNYINPAGFMTGIARFRPTSITTYNNGNPLTMISELRFSAKPDQSVVQSASPGVHCYQLRRFQRFPLLP